MHNATIYYVFTILILHIQEKLTYLIPTSWNRRFRFLNISLDTLIYPRS